MPAPRDRPHSAGQNTIRGYLLVLSTAMFAGTMFELYLVDHWHPGIMQAPFAICALGVAGNLVIWRAGNRRVESAVYYLMAFLIAGSLLGSWYHLRWNFRFESQFQPDASNSDLLRDALAGGAPFVAPGVMAAAAAITIIAGMMPVASGRTLTEAESETGPT